MKQDWWEKPVCWLCDYWWVLLILLILGLSAFFTKDLWMDLFGLTPTPIIPTPTIELGTGDVQVTLIWYTTDDLDLWVTDPEGESIGYSNDISPSGGELDVDANAGSVLTNEPVENIFWPTGEAPQGSFSVKVVYFRNKNAIEPVNYFVWVLVDGETTEYSGVLESENDEIVITTFER